MVKIILKTSNIVNSAVLEIVIEYNSSYSSSILERLLITSLVPGPVQDLKLTPSSTSMQVTWSPPEDDSCVTGYKIWRSDGNVEDLPVKPPAHEYIGLNSCQFYNISVASRSEKEIGPYTTGVSRTLAPTEGLSKVEDLKFTESETGENISVEWSVLPQEERCIKQYSITINNDSPLDCTQTVYVITKPIACQTYVVSVVAMGVDDTIQNSEPNVQEYTAKENVQNPPKISVNTESGIEINFLIFDVVIDPITVNVCQITSVEITCEAKIENGENDPSLSWVDSPVTNNFFISTEETEFQLEFTELFAYTNYTCYGISKTNTSSSPQSAEVKVTTKLFELPLYLNITDTLSNSFKIEWNSSVPEGTYLIEIGGLGPNHYIPEECKLDVKDIAETTKETTFMAKNLLPSYNYKVSVKIISWLGVSEPIATTHTTLTEASEKVRNPGKEIEIVSVEDYNVTANVFWTYPCNTNGKVSEFKIAIVETSIEHGNTNPSEDFVKIDESEPKLTYNYKIMLNPYSIYAITVNAVNEHAGLEETITFNSTEGFAEAPKTEITDITSTGFHLKWSHPTANGVLLKYQVKINDLGPKFVIPQGCEPQITPQVIVDVDKEITKFNYSGALAYHDYEIKVLAITEVGRGKESTSIKNTLGSEPQPIRYLLVNRFESHSSDEFYADMHTEFKQSCNLAGVFFEYEIHLIGEREDFEKHDERYTIRDINGIDTTKTRLRADYNYIVTGRVRNDVAVSADVLYQFKAPSGVPGLSAAANITAPDLTSSITFPRSSFTSFNGQVLYFAVLLSANYDFRDDYAYWESWPGLGQYTRGPGLVIEPYQITPVNWQPKTEEVISYELGNEHCEDQVVLCNGVLREETTYTVTVRGFTGDGYRDIRTHFNMPSLARSVSLGIILGITFGILFTGFIFIGSYVAYRRDMFRSTKPSENGRHSAINSHSTKDICIVLPPEAYKNDEENAGSFATLQKTSERNKGVTTAAEAEDNRRRNRYINILPFDSTRVVLNDGIESDYINASFIKGYSHQIEYIAAQGPLESTAEDFWRMVAQERVTTILMLTQLKEQHREKCFKYFPFNLESMRLNDINLYCPEEEVCKSYIQRKIVLDIGSDKFNIQHFQYTDWPDFYVPDGTESMIKFVKKIRKMKNHIGGVILVHCSAGVGRTGTLISIDILLQTIDNGQDYNIYQTVLDLRSQRVNMVQNEKQYLYIGSCVEDYVKSRRKSGVYIGTEEPIYANVISRKY